MRLLPRAWLALALAICICGCATSTISTRNKSPLAPIKPSLETSVLEVAFIRHIYEQAAFNEELWNDIDETAIPAEARQALLQNGLRAGVISGGLPTALESALNGQPPSEPAGEPMPSNKTGDKLEADPVISRRTLHALSGQRCELLSSGIYECLPLLIRDATEARGKSYNKAQCVIAATATPLGDQRVRVSIAPEVHHGEARQQYRGGQDGVWRIDASRPKIALDTMTFDVVLSTGQSIVLAARTDRPGSAGHYFFTEPIDGQLEQKLMLIRFEGTKYDSLLLNQRAQPPSE